MLLAIDIGSRHIHILEGEYKNKRFKIARRLTTLTPEGCILDGEIQDREALVTKLRNTINKHKITTKQVVFSINPGSLVSRKFLIPNVKKTETLPILQHEMDSLMHFSKPHIVDYTDIEPTEEGDFGVETVALPRELIKEYIDLCKVLKWKPVALDIHQNAVYKFVLTCDKIDYRNIIVADIGNQFMNTYLFRDGVRVFTRRMPINTEQYEKNLISQGKIKHFNKDFQTLNLAPDYLEKDPLLENTITLYLSNLVDQLQRVMQFHMSMGTKGQFSQVSHIYLCGAMAHMKGIHEYIASYVDVPTTSITELVNPRVCKLDGLPQYVNALGALMRLD